MRNLILMLFGLLAITAMSSAAVAQCGGRVFVSGSVHYSQPYRTHSHVRASQHGHSYHMARHSGVRQSGGRHHR